MKNKVILITGGTSGIGKSLVKLLQSDNKIIVCSRNQNKISECKKLFKDVHFVQADIENTENLNKLEHVISEKYGYLDVLINNAGIGNFVDLNKTKPITDFSDIDVNFKGTVQTTTTFIPLLLKSKTNPTIVVTSSILAKIPHYEMPIYSASKAALHSYCISLRAKMKPFNIVEVFPPLVDTSMTKDLKSTDKMNPEKVAAIIVSGIDKGKLEIYPGIARLANLMSKVAFKRISKIINTN